MPASTGTGRPGGFTRAVAATLRERRAYLEWTQQDLATKTDISQSHISQILKGQKHINMEQFGRFCDVMDLDPVQVIDRAWREATADEPTDAELEEQYSRLVPDEPGEGTERITGA